MMWDVGCGTRCDAALLRQSWRGGEHLATTSLHTLADTSWAPYSCLFFRNPTMALNKKDEDDAGILKVDRTSVFQEGQ